MEAAPPVLVISRSVEQERRIQRNGLIVISAQACNVVLCLFIAGLLLQSKKISFSAYTPLPMIAAGFGLYAMYGQLWWRHVNHQMRNLQLAFTEHGVTYSSAAGTFSAPWSSVRRVWVQGGGLSTYLIVDVEDWGGPVSKAGRVGRLTLPLQDTGIDELQIKRAVHNLSGGTIMALRR